MNSTFRNRDDAGQQLAERLAHELKGTPNIVVLGLARGGVPVAWEIARRLHAPLDALVVRKLGVPGDPECAMGAIAEPDVTELDYELIQRAQVSPKALQDRISAERDELVRRAGLYRGARPLPALKNKTVVLVDDGVATGLSLRAAITAVKRQHPQAIIVAVPVGSHLACNVLRSQVDQLICLHELTAFDSVGAWYQDFTQTSDQTVQHLLQPEHAP
jgi:predicted phosphoribosyltransferase